MLFPTFRQKERRVFVQVKRTVDVLTFIHGLQDYSVLYITFNSSGTYQAMASSYENFDTSLIVWFNASVDNIETNGEIQSQLRLTIHHIKVFNNINECEQYIQQAVDNRIYFIVYGQCADQVISQIHHLPQVFHIYIICNNSKKCERWMKNFPKVTHNNISHELCRVYRCALCLD